MNIICVGHAAYDITLPVEDFPIENTKIRPNQKIECGGGPASNAAYLLGKWGMNPYFMGIVGNDFYGNKIKEEFENVGVNTKYLELNDDFETTASFIIANKKIGSRTIITHRSKDMHMKKVDVNIIPDVLLFDGEEYDMSISLLEKYPEAISIIDAGSAREEVIELAKKVDYIVSSKNFAEDVTGIKIDNDLKSLEELYIKLKEIFKGTIIVTLEDRGCIFEKNGRLNLMSSIKVKAVDTTAAGDIFHGAFTYGIAKKMDLEKVLKLATITAGLSVTRLGGRNSIFTFDEIREFDYEFK